MKKKKLLTILVILVLFAYGIYMVFPYYIDWAIRTDLANYDEEVSSYYATLDSLEIYEYEDDFIPVAYGSIWFGEGIIAINEQGEHRRFISPFKYSNHMKELYYNDGELWIFPGYYSTIMYIYDIPWIYKVNTTTGEISHKLFTDNITSADGYCTYNDSLYVIFENQGKKSSYLRVENGIIKDKLILEKGVGGHMIDFECTQEGLISNHYGEVFLYNFSNTNRTELILNLSPVRITYDGKEMLYYIYYKNNKSMIDSYNINSKEIKSYTTNNTIWFENIEYFNQDFLLLL